MKLSTIGLAFLAACVLVVPERVDGYNYSSINALGGMISGDAYTLLPFGEEFDGWRPCVRAKIVKSSTFQTLYDSQLNCTSGSESIPYVSAIGSGYYQLDGQHGALDAIGAYVDMGETHPGTTVTDPNDGPPVMWGLNPSSSNASSGYIEIYGQRLYPSNGWSTVHMDNLWPNGNFYTVYQSEGQINIYYYNMPGGYHNVWVETNNGSSSYASFQVTGQEPTINSLYPAYGTTGVSGNLEVSGNHLYVDYGWNEVRIDGISQTIVWHNGEDSVTINYSGLSSGTHYVTVETANGTSIGTAFYVGDPTPEICSLSGTTTWEGGVRSSFRIWGNGFGNDPVVNISGNGITQFDRTGWVDSQSGNCNAWIDMYVDVDQDAPDGSATVSVTSRGYSGNGWMQAPGSGSSQNSNQAQPNPVIRRVDISMKLELLGTEISDDGHYYEDSTIKVTAVRKNGASAGSTVAGSRRVNLSEDGSTAYSQNGGVLPTYLDLSSDGTGTFLARSLAGPKTEGSLGTKPDIGRIKTTNYSVYGASHVLVPQWIVPSTPIHPLGAGAFGWVQKMVKDLYAAHANDNVGIVLGKVSSYKAERVSGGWGQTPIVPGASQSEITVNPFQKQMRLNSSVADICSHTSHRQLFNTFLHEARHAYQLSSGGGGNDADLDILTASPLAIAPTSIIHDTTTARLVCTSGTHQLKSFLGPNIFDPRGDNNSGVIAAIQDDATEFAQNNDQ